MLLGNSDCEPFGLWGIAGSRRPGLETRDGQKGVTVEKL